VLQKITEERKYTEEQKRMVTDPCGPILAKEGVFSVGDLRALTKEQIMGYDLPDVVKNYLVRVMAGGKQ
jgi:hypothetical protein